MFAKNISNFGNSPRNRREKLGDLLLVPRHIPQHDVMFRGLLQPV